jgi:glycosyltransferase involved in cell wall biosynthesis
MDEKLLVSFVVPIYKTEKYLEKSLKSLLDQEYKNIEIICVLDGKNSSAERICKKLKSKDKRIKQILIIEHSGANKARNYGFKYTMGDIVSFWDSDCYAEYGMVRMWNKIFSQNKDIDFLYSDYRFNDQNQTSFTSQQFDDYQITCGNYIATMFPMRREVFPGFDENLKSLQDWDMWLTVIEKGHKGYYLEGKAFTTEMRKGISSEGCHPDEWLKRYNTVREKHGIKDRQICFTSLAAPARAKNLARILKQDFQDDPSFHPHEYKAIYCVGFYASAANVSTQAFVGASKDCKKIVHWIGEDIESFFTLPYGGVKILVSTMNNAGIINYTETEQGKQMLESLGFQNIEVKPLPMDVVDVPLPKDFKIFYEYDGKTKDLMTALINSCPDIKFETPDYCNLGDYACFLSITGSEFPSENMKRFIASGRPVITNYKMLYANYTEPKREDIVRKIRELKKNWKKYKPNEKAVEHYKNLLSVETFDKSLKELINAKG